jgi:hypothetical protein
MDTGNTIWLADGWPNGIVHTHVRFVTVGRPDLLRLDRRHNQAKSDQQVIRVYCKAGAFCNEQIPPSQRAGTSYCLCDL